jgi:uncharacterized protein YndB with AHSA1/START domain
VPHTLRREDLSFVEHAPIVLSQEVVVAAPPSRVWPALADATAWNDWFADTKDAHYTSAEPHGVGSTRHLQVKSLKVDEEVLAFDPDERFAFCVTGASVPILAAMVEVITLEPSGDGTRVVYRQALELKPWARLLAPLLRRQLTAGLRDGLAGLQRWATR